MSRADVVTAAIEHAIPVNRLVMFVDLTVSGWPRHELRSVLSAYRPAEVVIGAGQLAADDVGITLTGLHGGHPVTVTWDELTGYLLAVITPTRAEALIDAYRRTSAEVEDPDHARRLAQVRAELAYDAVSTAGLIPPSLFAGTIAERVIIDGPGHDGGFNGRVTLDPSGDNAVICRVNGVGVVAVSAAAEAHRVVARVHDGAETGDGSADRQVGFIATVRHVPPGESNAPLPATFARRVGTEVLDEDPTGSRWAVQVDGFDVVIMEAANALAPTVRAAVYDADPAQPFQRYEGRCTVPASPPGIPRDAGAAVNRLHQLRPPRSPGRAR